LERKLGASTAIAYELSFWIGIDLQGYACITIEPIELTTLFGGMAYYDNRGV
jgi:hypothetical protein